MALVKCSLASQFRLENGSGSRSSFYTKGFEQMLPLCERVAHAAFLASLTRHGNEQLCIVQ